MIFQFWVFTNSAEKSRPGFSLVTHSAFSISFKLETADYRLSKNPFADYRSSKNPFCLAISLPVTKATSAVDSWKFSAKSWQTLSLAALLKTSLLTSCPRAPPSLSTGRLACQPVNCIFTMGGDQKRYSDAQGYCYLCTSLSWTAEIRFFWWCCRILSENFVLLTFG